MVALLSGCDVAEDSFAKFLDLLAPVPYALRDVSDIENGAVLDYLVFVVFLVVLEVEVEFL